MTTSCARSIPFPSHPEAAAGDGNEPSAETIAVLAEIAADWARAAQALARVQRGEPPDDPFDDDRRQRP